MKLIFSNSFGRKRKNIHHLNKIFHSNIETMAIGTPQRLKRKVENLVVSWKNSLEKHIGK